MAVVLPGDDNPVPTHWLDVLLVLTGYRCSRRQWARGWERRTVRGRDELWVSQMGGNDDLTNAKRR
jgi:hypothetical protein